MHLRGITLRHPQDDSLHEAKAGAAGQMVACVHTTYPSTSAMAKRFSSSSSLAESVLSMMALAVTLRRSVGGFAHLLTELAATLAFARTVSIVMFFANSSLSYVVWAQVR